MNLNLFDTRGNFIANPAVLDQLTPDVRAAVERVGEASKHLAAATAAVTDAEKRLKDTRADIAAIEQTLPRQTHTNLAKAFIRDSNLRRAGGSGVYD